jgi:hypothetical protein
VRTGFIAFEIRKMKTLNVVALSVAFLPTLAVSQGYTNDSEVTLYGLSPPVYPSRKFPYTHR